MATSKTRDMVVKILETGEVIPHGCTGICTDNIGHPDSTVCEYFEGFRPMSQVLDPTVICSRPGYGPCNT